MATEKPDTALKGLECSICAETFTVPKILDCLHSFCNYCLKRYHRSSGAPMIICPLCRKETRLPEKGVEGLKTNFHIVGLIDEVTLLKKTASSGKTKLTCEQCHDGNEATLHCIDCSQNICQTCLDIHKRISALSSHVTASLEDIRQGKVQVKRKEVIENRCHKHQGEVQRFYCETCKELICRDCTVLDHCKPQHHFVDYKEAAEKGKRELKNIFPDLHKVMNELSQSIASASRVRQEFSKNVTQTKTKVQEAAAEVIAKVKAEEKRLIDEIEKLEERRGQTFDEHDKEGNDMLQRLQHSVETAEGWTETPSDWNFLSVYQIIEKDLKSLTSSQDIPEIDQSLSYLKLSQTGHPDGDIDLGKLVLEDAKWELGLEFGKDETNKVGYCDICFLETDKISVVDSEGKQIITFNTKGEKESVIQMEARPHRVASINSQLIVTDRTDHVKVYNKDNTLAFQFPTTIIDSNTSVDLRGVVMKQNVIIVGDYKNNVLTEHRPDGSLIRTIPVKIKPRFLAVDSNGRVVISSRTENEWVDVIDGKGATLFTIKPTIKDQQIKYCRGVCCDGTDIYIAMVGSAITTGHIHRYDGDGRFHSCVVSGLYTSVGITLSPKRDIMAVADWKSVKIFHKV